ncbi:TrmB family transcriptional regulator [Haladaptatus cibarius]|uniref:TrmB family transcriptional regulator n=1 Tax=Haladaptatus cibarius TaxID=453847 RepID=UPI0006791172|nr:helix-turn-helix domain-containing protein [Haladaptatus cibarius]
MDEDDAISALSDLGLSNYEAKVFVALQKLGTGTARDIHSVTDVPRSQVYGAAETLQERGLVELQQSKPIQYRPVSLDAAKSHLRDRFERTQERAFDYLETAQNEFVDGEEEREDVWSVDGRDAVSSRLEQLVEEAESRIVFAVHDASLFTRGIADALRERADAGVSILVVTDNPAVHNRVEDLPVIDMPGGPEEHRAGRVAVVDDDTMLISVFGENENESAIWSSQTGFAAILSQFIDARLEDAARD